MIYLISGSVGNGNFEVSGSSVNDAAQWTFTAGAGDVAGRNAGAGAHDGTGAFAVSSGASISGSGVAVSAIPTIVGHTYECKAWIAAGAAVHNITSIYLGEGTPVTIQSGSTSAYAQFTKTWQAAGTSFQVLTVPTGLGDVITVAGVTWGV